MDSLPDRCRALLLLAGVAALGTLARADTPPDPVQHAEQDLKDAGHTVAVAAREGAQKVKQAVDEGTQAVKQAVHKGAESVEEKTRGE